MFRHFNYLFIFTLLTAFPLKSEEMPEGDDFAAADSVSLSDGCNKGNVVSRVIEYFHQSNKKALTRRPDFAPLGGPFYTSEKGFGIGLVIAGDYSTCPSDTLLPTSNVSLTGSVATKKYYSIGIEGTHVFPHDSRRLNYSLDFVSFGTYFWGIGYKWDNDNANKTKYSLLDITLSADYEWRLFRDLFIGPAMEVSYTNAHSVTDYTPWAGQDLRYWTMSAGILMQSDTRDNLTAPHCGHLFELVQLFSPRFLGNKGHAFSSTEIGYNMYTPLWRGAILASRIHGKWTYGDTPWGKLPSLDGNAIRGYYKGRYRDKCETDIYVELRQHVYRRSGVAVWGGVGTIYHKFSDLSFKRLLPEFGIGYRWEFKKNTNVRLDVGFGKHSSGFLFGINEAF
ncbi:MAG: BamA/TamA family outer membrane protein [Bacteroides sp.]|nr:BamA/TamA family outer membrane protein [Bacteroides sp.]